MVIDVDGRTNDGSESGPLVIDGLKPSIILDKFDYEIARWIAHSELKRQTKAVDVEIQRHARLRILSTISVFGMISDYLTGGDAVTRENQSLLIDEYWSTVSIDVKYKGLTNEQIRSVLVLQNTFRTWIILKRYRETLKMKATVASKSFGDDKTISTSLYIQSSVRRVLARAAVEARIVANKARDKSFTRFCCLMKEGVSITMFSRKYGTAPSRKLSLDSSYNNLTFSTSFGTRGKVPIKSIYKIHTGISETLYPHARQAVLSRCICLECLGERVVDMELSNAQQARDMFLGFQRLILLLSGTASPFYVDNLGIPRRGGSSIIENAIDEDHDSGNQAPHRSKPDEMRFWGSIRLLQQEYDTWQSERNAERTAHLLQKEAEAERALDRLKLNEMERLTLDSVDRGHKVMKLVRFIDEDGVSKIIEDGSHRIHDAGMRSKVLNLSPYGGNIASSETKSQCGSIMSSLKGESIIKKADKWNYNLFDGKAKSVRDEELKAEKAASLLSRFNLQIDFYDDDSVSLNKKVFSESGALSYADSSVLSGPSRTSTKKGTELSSKSSVISYADSSVLSGPSRTSTKKGTELSSKSSAISYADSSVLSGPSRTSTKKGTELSSKSSAISYADSSVPEPIKALTREGIESSSRYSRKLSSSSLDQSSMSKASTLVRSLWGSILCFAPKPIPDDHNYNDDAIMTTEEDDQSTMTCGVQYESSAFNSDSSDEDNDDEERKSNGFNDDNSYISYAGDSSKDSRRNQFLMSDDENISDDALCESDSSDDSSHETAL